MRIEQGFGKFLVGEEITITLMGIQYTKQNHRPYARCKDDNDNRFNVNIKDSDASLPKGRYKILCTGVNEAGFCYVELNKLQHTSWDIRDEALQETLKEQKSDNVDMVFSINLTKYYKERLKYHSKTVNEHIDAILQELYREYGELVVNEMECEDIELP